ARPSKATKKPTPTVTSPAIASAYAPNTWAYVGVDGRLMMMTSPTAKSRYPSRRITPPIATGQLMSRCGRGGYPPGCHGGGHCGPAHGCCGAVEGIDVPGGDESTKPPPTGERPGSIQMFLGAGSRERPKDVSPAPESAVCDP